MQTYEQEANLALGQALRDAAVNQTGTKNRNFVLVALDAVREVIAHQQFFIIDDVWAVIPRDVDVTDKRAVGSAMVQAKKLGLIRPTDHFQPSAQPQCHANPRRVWERV
jgi:hypothetical protein